MGHEQKSLRVREQNPARREAFHAQIAAQPATFEAAFAEGYAMSYDEAIAHALEVSRGQGRSIRA